MPYCICPLGSLSVILKYLSANEVPWATKKNWIEKGKAVFNNPSNIQICLFCPLSSFYCSLVCQHDLTFCAQSCTTHQMEIFAQEFDWTCVHLITRRQKQSPISEYELIQKMKLSKNGFIISCSPNLIISTETKIKTIKLTFEIQNWL